MWSMLHWMADLPITLSAGSQIVLDFLVVIVLFSPTRIGLLIVILEVHYDRAKQYNTPKTVELQ